MMKKNGKTKQCPYNDAYMVPCGYNKKGILADRKVSEEAPGVRLVCDRQSNCWDKGVEQSAGNSWMTWVKGVEDMRTCVNEWK